MTILPILGFVFLFLLALWFLAVGLIFIVGDAFFVPEWEEGVILLVLSGLVFWLAFYLLPLHVTFN